MKSGETPWNLYRTQTEACHNRALCQGGVGFCAGLSLGAAYSIGSAPLLTMALVWSIRGPQPGSAPGCTSLGGARVMSVLERLEELRGLPDVITMDNGPEFAGRALDEWAYRKDVKLNFIRPGKPIENAYAESFIGRLRDECLNQNWFMNLRHARDIIENWRRDYNEVRPHSSLNDRTPMEYAVTAAGL